MTTIADLLRLALPRESRLVSGQAYLQTPVTWAAALRPSPPAFSNLGGGELILIDPADLQVLDPYLSLAAVLSDLAGMHIAGVAVKGPIDADATRAAETLRLPLLTLPADVRLIEVERDIIRVIVNRQAQLERFAGQVTSELTGLVIAGASINQIVQAIARLANCHIILHNRAGELVAVASPPGELLEDAVLAALQEPTRGVLESKDQQTMVRRPLPDARGECWSVFVAGNGQPFGLLSAVGSNDRLDDITRLALERGALTCSLELGRRQSISETELARRRQFLRDLIVAPDPAATGLAQRALQWDYELDRRQVAFQLGSDQPIPMALLYRCAQVVEEELRQRRVAALVVPNEETGQVAICCGLGPGKPARRGRRLAQALYERLSAQLPSVRLRLGVGRSEDGAAGLIQSLAEATQALQLSVQIGKTDPVSYYGDMGLFRLLLPLQGSDVLRKFYDETLSALAAYDARQQTSLVETLGAYFANHGNLSRTAEMLFLHRNTLLYRMERIAAIIGHDLDDPEFRLMLQVAFKVQQLL